MRRQRRPGPGTKSSLPPEILEELRSSGAGKTGPLISAAERAVRALSAGHLKEAEAAAGEAKRLAPRSPAVREILGMALYRRGRYREALRDLQAYRRMTGQADQNHLIADCHRALGSPAKAVPLVQEALKGRLRPETRAEAVVVGASALADLGRFQEALSLLRRHDRAGDRAHPYDLRLWYVRADVLERAGRPLDAAREFRRILDHDPQAFDVAERLAALSG